MISPVYNLTLAPERESPWYRDAHPTTSFDRFHRCPSEGCWASGGRGLHANGAFAYLILYGSMPGRLLIPIMKIKCARPRFVCHIAVLKGQRRRVIVQLGVLSSRLRLLSSYFVLVDACGSVLDPNGPLLDSIQDDNRMSCRGNQIYILLLLYKSMKNASHAIITTNPPSETSAMRAPILTTQLQPHSSPRQTPPQPWAQAADFRPDNGAPWNYHPAPKSACPRAPAKRP